MLGLVGRPRELSGDALASSFAGAATGLSRLIGLINGNPQAIAELKAILSGKGGVDQAAIDQAAQDVARSRASRALSGSAAAPQQAQFHINRLGGAANLAEWRAILSGEVAAYLPGAASTIYLSPEWPPCPPAEADVREAHVAQLAPLLRKPWHHDQVHRIRSRSRARHDIHVPRWLLGW